MKARGDDVFIPVQVRPRSSRNSLQLGQDGMLRISVTAPPAANAANTAVRDYIARVLGVSKSRVQLYKGAHSREKLFTISDISTAAVLEKLVPIITKC